MKYLLLFVAGAFLLIGAVLHGQATDRWGKPPEFVAAAQKLAEIPERIGEWVGHPTEIRQRDLDIAQVVGHVSRRYVRRSTGEEVSLFIVAGRPGQIAVHPPTICYQGAGFTNGVPEKRDIADNRFWTTSFVRAGSQPEILRIFWAWGDGRRWVASDNPRIEFSREPVLYKLYLVRRMPRVDDKASSELMQSFLKDLQTELSRIFSETKVSHVPHMHGVPVLGVVSQRTLSA